MRSFKRYCCVFICFLGLVVQASGQEKLKIVEADLGNKLFKNRIPYDVPFFLDVATPEAVTKLTVNVYKTFDPANRANMTAIQTKTVENEAKKFTIKMDPISPIIWRKSNLTFEIEYIPKKAKKELNFETKITSSITNLDPEIEVNINDKNNSLYINLDTNALTISRKQDENPTVDIAYDSSSRSLTITPKPKDADKPKTKRVYIEDAPHKTFANHFSWDVGVGQASQKFNAIHESAAIYVYSSLHIYLAPINKDADIAGNPRKDWKKKLSIFAGWTHGRIHTSREGIADLSSVGSIIFGSGYRFTEKIKLMVGTIALRQTQGNPVADVQNIKWLAFHSLSADIDFEDTVGKLLKAFVGK